MGLRSFRGRRRRWCDLCRDGNGLLGSLRFQHSFRSLPAAIGRLAIGGSGENKTYDFATLHALIAGHVVSTACGRGATGVFAALRLPSILFSMRRLPATTRRTTRMLCFATTQLVQHFAQLQRTYLPRRSQVPRAERRTCSKSIAAKPGDLEPPRP